MKLFRVTVLHSRNLDNEVSLGDCSAVHQQWLETDGEVNVLSLSLAFYCSIYIFIGFSLIAVLTAAVPIILA